MRNLKPSFLIGPALILLVLASYWHVLGVPFYFDSEGNLTQDIFARVSREFSFLRLFTQVRYLTQYSMDATYHLFGLSTFWFRLGNVTLHCLNTVLVFIFSKLLFTGLLPKRDDEVFRGTVEPLIAAVLFGFSPMAVYAAAYVIQRFILMATSFSLLAAIAWIKGLLKDRDARGAQGWALFFPRGGLWYFCSALFYFCAIHSKEHAVMLPVILVLLTLLFHKHKIDKTRIAGMVFPCLLMLLMALHIIWLQKWLVGSAYEPHLPTALENMQSQFAADEPGFHIDKRWVYPLSIMNQLWLFFRYLYLWLIPDVTRMAIFTPRPFYESPWTPNLVAGVVMVLTYAFFAMRSLWSKEPRRRLLGFGLMCPLVLFATELSTVRFHENFVLYRSYLWVWGFFSFVPFIFQTCTRKRIVIFLAIWFVVLMGALQQRLWTFRDAVSLWEDVVAQIDATDRRIPATYLAWGNLGAAYGNAGRFEDAVHGYEKSLKLYPDYQKAWYGLGVVYYNAQKYRESIPYFLRGAEDDPPHKASPYRLGTVYDILGDLSLSEKYLRLSFKLNPEHLETKEALGNVLFKQGRVDEAYEWYRLSLEDEPGFVKGWNGIGKVMMRKRDFQKAIEAFSSAIRVLPSYNESYYNLGAVYSELGQCEKAMVYYQQALARDQDYREALYNMGNCLVRLQRPQEAIIFYERVLRLQPDNSDAHHNLGIALASIDKHQEAITHYQSVIKANPAHAKAHYNLANSLYALGRLGEAVESYQVSLKFEPQSLYALHNIGVILVQLQKPDEAKGYFKRALSLNPGFEPSLEQLKGLK